MRSLHLTVALICHLLLAAALIYIATLSAASPLFSEPNHAPAKPKEQPAQKQQAAPGQPEVAPEPSKASPLASPEVEQKQSADKFVPPKLEARSGAPAQVPVPAAAPKKEEQQYQTPTAKAAPISEVKPSAEKRQSPALGLEQVAPSKKEEQAPESELSPKSGAVAEPAAAKTSHEGAALEASKPKKAAESASAPTSPLDTQQAAKPVEEKKLEVAPQPAALVAPSSKDESAGLAVGAPVAPVSQVQQQPVQPSVVVKEAALSEPLNRLEPPAAVKPGPVESVGPVARTPAPVMGGLGPLHLLATTLCSYQPDKPVADENLNQLYARRASVRKSLFDFMSLKFTNLEKLSSRLGLGLQVVPAVAKSPAEESKGLMPSHGWPVVGKCTAYDLKLMGEAAWCECQASDNCHEADSAPKPDQQQASSLPAAAAVGKVLVAAATATAAAANDDDGDERPAAIASNQHALMATGSRVGAARSLGGASSYSLLPTPEESSVISKILHVSDVKDTPLVESSIYNLNLTQHQLATLEAHAISTQECRRNALRYSKALLNHLAEDQRSQSMSWPKLYAAISADDCARKRVTDIMNALSSFRTDTTSIRRDNLEFAFAMDDLRAKVLENEVNVPLTFDRHFIEVEQFLQQSVRLMLANIQPKRAKLTSMRYRSLMYGSPSDEQCIDLHQRLLARNYPSDCNPTQFGQLPDVLRMTASSLELWSIEKELSMRMAKVVDYPNESPVGQQKVKEDVNECIANLVSS